MTIVSKPKRKPPKAATRAISQIRVLTSQSSILSESGPEDT